MTVLPEQKIAAAFFDLDLTLTNQDSFRLFIKTWYLKKLSRSIYLPYLVFYGLLRKLRLISLQTFKEKVLTGLKGMPLEEIMKTGTDFFNSNLKKTLREKAIQRVLMHKKKGNLVFIISASPDIYVHAVCQHLDCDGYACTRLAYEQGLFIGKFSGPDCIGKEKTIQIQNYANQYRIDLETSYAYSDHEADLMFLKAAGKKIAVTPTGVLEKIALAERWRIEQW